MRGYDYYENDDYDRDDYDNSDYYLCPHTTVLSRRWLRDHSRWQLAASTLMEICNWYYNATRLCYKREHAWGSPECTDSAKLRQTELGS